MAIQTYRTWRAFGASLAFSALVVAPGPATAGDVTVFAAASLKNALDAVVEAYGAATGKTVTVSYAATPALARQIEAGAPADMVLTADVAWMDYLEARGLIDRQSRQPLVGNSLVLIVPKDSMANVTAGHDTAVADLLGPRDGRLAVANVAAVPAGRYAKAALETLGQWPAVVGRLVETENVRAALAFVARGEAPAGIVYATDAAAEPAVKVVGRFAEDTHPPILYLVAMTATADETGAGAFFQYLTSSASRPAFEGEGFVFLAPGG